MNKQKIGTLVITGLLITSLFATPVSALLVMDYDGIFDFFQNNDQSNEVEEVREKWDEQNDLEDTQTLTDLKYLAESTNYTYHTHLDIVSNYLQDSKTTVWSKAEAKAISEIKEAQDNNDNLTENELENIGNETIEDYYSRMEMNLLKTWEASHTNAKYIKNVAIMEDGLDSSYVDIKNGNWNGSGTNYSYELTNHSTTQVNTYTVFDGQIVKAKNRSLNYIRSDESYATEGNSTSGIYEYLDDKSIIYNETENAYQMDKDLVDTYFNFMKEPNSPGQNIKSFSITLRADGSSDDTISVSLRDYNTADGKASDQDPGFIELHYYGSTLEFDYVNTTYNYNISMSDTYTLSFTDIDRENDTFALSVNGKDKNYYESTNDWSTSGLDMKGVKVSEGGTTDQSRVYIYNIDYAIESDDVSTVFVTDDGELTEDRTVETIHNLDRMETVLHDINSTNEMLKDNWKLYAENLYSNYENGTLENVSDYISAGTLAQEYQQKYNETGYWGYAMAYLSVNGLETPNLNNTSMMYIEYEDNGTTKSTQGMLMSQEGPTYQDANYTNGTWYTDMEYNAQEIPGMQIIVPTESDEMIELEGNFTITRMVNKEGEDINSSTTKEYVYETTNVTELQNLQEDLTELRQELEDREPKVGGTLDDGSSSIDLGPITDVIDRFVNSVKDLFNMTIAGLPIAIIIVLVFAVLVLMN